MTNAVNSKSRNLEIQRWIAGLLFLLLLATSTSFAQLPTATILGVVKDASGAVVPDASLTARNVETGQTRTTVSAADGSYRFPALPVGSYEVRAEHPGFQSEVRSGLTLAVAQEAVVNMTLQVGAVEQTVAVTAEAPLVNTTSGSLGGLVGEEKIADLPLNGRNYIDLTLMQTGISEQKTANAGSGGHMGTYFSSNGATVRSNNYLLDGAILTNVDGATSSSVSNATLGVEGIREFRVITNSFSAEYGMTMGSQMLLVSKGGTNNFHGSLFEYLRNSALDARNFFDYTTAATPRRLPAFTRNNFGAAFGGPIKKDKTFFYGVFEGVRERKGITSLDTVPPAACHGAGGTTITNTACPQLGTTPVTILPAVAPLLALFPNPNFPNNQFTFPFSQPTTENYGQMRVDQNFSSNETLFARYTIDDGQKTQSGTYPQFAQVPQSRGQLLTLSENHVFSPNLLNTFRASLSRSVLNFSDLPTEPNGPLVSLVPGRPIAGLAIGGLTTLGSNSTGPFLRKQNIFTYSDDIFYTRGRHSLKFGTLINHYQMLIEQANTAKGAASFANLASFFQGRATTITALKLGSPTQRTFHYNTVGFYAQDDLRVRSNLTFNLGLRYEFTSVPQEQHGQWSTFRDIQHDTAPTISSAMYANPTLKNFSPRFGFAWDVKGDGKMAVRGGFGLLYDIGNIENLIVVGTTGQLPFNVTQSANNPPVFTVPLTFPPGLSSTSSSIVDYHFKQPHMLQYNLTVERQLPFDMALTLAYAGSRGFNLTDVEAGNPLVPQVLPDGRRFWPVNASPTNPNVGTLNLYTTGAGSWYNALQFGLIKRLGKGLQFQSSYNWSHLLDTLANQFMGENSLGQASLSTDPYNIRNDKAPSPFDLTQVWKFNAIYRLPGLASSSGVASKLLNGWWMSGILTLQGGTPFTVGLSSGRSRTGVAGIAAIADRPDLVVGRNAANIISGTSVGCLGFPAGTPLGTPNHYFDPCAFTIPAAGFVGTAGRNILRGKGFEELNFSLVKDTAIKQLGESGKLEFRAEFFNILNRANFGFPSRNVFAGTADVQAPLANAGLITSTIGSSRQIQLALKILF